MSVSATLMTLEPETTHSWAMDVVLFRVIDSLSAKDTARGDYPRPIPGVMRPMLKWTTSYTPQWPNRRRLDLLTPAITNDRR